MALSFAREYGERQVYSLREILAQQPIGVLIASPLPRVMGIAEIELDAVASVKRLCPAISLTRSQVIDLWSSIVNLHAFFDQRVGDGLGIFAGELYQHPVARLPFDELRNLAALTQ